MKSFIYKILSLKQGEFALLSYATLFVFLLFSSYAILRPIRDSLGLEGGEEELKWLFLATFLATLLGSILAMFVSTKVKRKFYINTIFIFFSSNLILFYLAFSFFAPHTKEFLWLSRTFYVWVSVFNLFIISSAWSLLSDIFSKERSQRLFGIISAGASLGSILGASLVSFMSFIGNNEFIFLSIFFLLLTLFCKNLMIKQSFLLLENKEAQSEFIQNFNTPIGSKNPFLGFLLIIKSRYLLMLLVFILLLTSVSTFLYMEQARIIKVHFPSREERATAFANIDLIVQSVSFIIQIFFTSKIVQFFGLRSLLALLGFLIGFGFIALAFSHPAFLPLVLVMSLRRIGEYALVKPGREMLFVPLDSDSKYKVKAFLDTVVYRGGDAISSQLEGVLAKISITLVLIVGAFLSFIWGILGLSLAKHYENKYPKNEK
ncbi:MAG: MFS transporter [Helicobacter sp.]|nr:MFS transporter [Helicobacter sp.]